MSKFSDPADEAAHIEEQFTQRSIEAVLRAGNQPQLPFTGRCHDCGDTVQDPRRFCDEECAQEWEYVQKRKRANGRA